MRIFETKEQARRAGYEETSNSFMTFTVVPYVLIDGTVTAHFAVQLHSAKGTFLGFLH